MEIILWCRLFVSVATIDISRLHLWCGGSILCASFLSLVFIAFVTLLVVVLGKFALISKCIMKKSSKTKLQRTHRRNANQRMTECTQKQQFSSELVWLIACVSSSNYDFTKIQTSLEHFIMWFVCVCSFFVICTHSNEQHKHAHLFTVVAIVREKIVQIQIIKPNSFEAIK